MDTPVNIFMVHVENDKICTRYTDYQKAADDAKKYDLVVVKEKDANVWYVVAGSTKQCTWIEPQ